jgi:hypothetical protein
MAGMQKVEAAVRENEALPMAVRPAKPGNRFFSTKNARVQRVSLRACGTFACKARKPVF